jgi:methionyl aminopeptidase
MPIILKSDDEIAIMREAGRHVAEVLDLLAEACRPGAVEIDLDALVRREFKKRGVEPTFLGYLGYPATVCISINDEIVHGIPGKRVIEEGDVVSLDLGCTHRGFVADSARTIIVGEGEPRARELVDVARQALDAGIREAHAGNRLGQISHAIQQHIESHGFGVVREYVGHGVGRQMHEEPQVPNFGPADRGPVLKKGMVLALEPMVTAGDWHTRRLDDDWTVVTADGSLSAHFEHTIAVTNNGPEVLTRT